MRTAVLRIQAFFGVLALASGCGGCSAGSGGGPIGGGPTTVTFTITGTAPNAVATQVGTGPFAAATLKSGAVTIDLPSGTTNFAVAFACSPYNFGATNQSAVFEFIFEGSTFDGSSFSEPCSEPAAAPSSTGTLTGSLDASAIPIASAPGVGPFLNINAWGNTSSASYSEFAASSNFSFLAPSGQDRVEVEAYNSFYTSVVGLGEGIGLAAVRDFSSQTVPGVLNGGNPIVFGPADQTTPEPITYGNLPSTFLQPYTTVTLRMSGDASMAVANPATTQYPALPASAVESGDYYSFYSVASNSGQVVAGLEVGQTSPTAIPLDVVFPPAWFYAGPKAAALPTFDLAYSGFSGATNAGVYEGAFLIWQPDSSTIKEIDVTATVNFLNGSTSLVIPDISAMPGFLASPASGTRLLWSASISHSTSPLLQPMPKSGTVTTVSNSGWLIVP